MPSLVLSTLWGCTVPAITIIVARLIYRRVKGLFDVGDWFAVLSLALISTRLGLHHTAFTLGTALMSDSVRASLTPSQIEGRELGSRTQFAGRAVFTAFIWSQKCVLFAFYQQLIRKLRWQRQVRTAFWLIFAMTFAGVEVATFLDCRPFRLFFTVVPDPGTCIRAYGQQIAYGITGIVTDIMLIVLPLRILSLVNRPFRQKLQLGLLFSIGFFIVAITVIRVHQVFTHGGSHTIRTVWGSAEVLASVIVANSPAIYGAYHMDRKGKFTTPSSAGISITRTTELQFSALKARDQDYTSIISKTNSDGGRRNDGAGSRDEFPMP